MGVCPESGAMEGGSMGRKNMTQQKVCYRPTDNDRCCLYPLHLQNRRTRLELLASGRPSPTMGTRASRPDQTTKLIRPSVSSTHTHTTDWLTHPSLDQLSQIVCWRMDNNGLCVWVCVWRRRWRSQSQLIWLRVCYDIHTQNGWWQQLPCPALHRPG